MASSAAQMQTAYNLVLWDAAGRKPLYETGDKIYIRSEYDAAGQTTFKQNPYTITRPGTPVTDGAGNLLDANGATALGVTVPGVSTIGAALDTAAEWPTFYTAVQDSNASNEIIIHESLILSLAGVNIIRDANDWT